MIRRFGQGYKSVISNDVRLKNITNIEYGKNIIPNYSISLDMSVDDIPGDTSVARIVSHLNLNRTISEYDEILFEYTLDRIIFGIANNLNNNIAKEFRASLIWNIIPHFQQTATQDQINQVPILNQTSKFMYDDTNYSTVTVQQYNFAKQTIEFHINRISILTNSPTTEDTIFAMLKDFDCALQNNNEASLETITNKYMQTLRKVIGANPDQYTIFDTLDAIIGNRRIYMIFICYMINTIRELENEKIRNAYGMQEEFIEYNGHRLRGISCIDKDILMKDSPVEFLSVEDKYDLDHINECRKYTFEDLINGKKIE